MRKPPRWIGRAGGLSLLAAVLGTPSCASSRRGEAGAPAYPALDQGRTLDIQVVRRGTQVEMTNTTARAYEHGRIWLNRRFSREIDEKNPWRVGTTLHFSLFEFVDENGERFRGGGFFAAEAPAKLVQAQLETSDEKGERMMLGLVVVGGE